MAVDAKLAIEEKNKGVDLTEEKSFNQNIAKAKVYNKVIEDAIGPTDHHKAMAAILSKIDLNKEIEKIVEKRHQL